MNARIETGASPWVDSGDWTVDTPLLPEGVPMMYADPGVFFFGRGEGEGLGSVRFEVWLTYIN